MKYKKCGNNYVLVLQKGEDINSSILKLAKAEDIKLGVVNGIGASDDFLLGVFNITDKKYDEHHYTGNHEIASLCGNITTMNGEKYVHLHMTAANADETVCAGHLINGRISMTAEIFITVFEGAVDRTYDENLGINILECE